MPFDLVITDIVMPEKDRIQTMSFIRKEYLKTKIIAISAACHALFLESAL